MPRPFELPRCLTAPLPRCPQVLGLVQGDDAYGAPVSTPSLVQDLAQRAQAEPAGLLGARLNAFWGSDEFPCTVMMIRHENGRFEVCAKVPPFRRGVWPAIWMMPTDSKYGRWPASGEIDILECVGHKRATMHASVHTTAANHRAGKLTSGHWQCDDADGEFHVYALEWSPARLRFFRRGLLLKQRGLGCRLERRRGTAAALQAAHDLASVGACLGCNLVSSLWPTALARAEGGGGHVDAVVVARLAFVILTVIAHLVQALQTSTEAVRVLGATAEAGHEICMVAG